MSFVLRPPDEIVPLNRRLIGIGRARRIALVAAGALSLVAAVGVALALLGSLDSWLHLAGAVRAVGLLALVGLVGAVFVRCVRRPAREPADSIAVAQFIETRYPEFNDALASAAAFHDRDGDTRTSVRFRKAAIRRAERMTDRHDLAGIVPTGRVWRALAAALGSILLLGILIAPDAGRAAVAARRLFDPFGNHPWPPKTRLDVLEPSTSPVLLAKGDAFPIRFKVRGVIPPEAVLSVRLSGSAAHDEPIPLANEAEKELRIEHVLLPDRTTRDFEFRLVANDADSGWRSVTVAAPPRLTLLDGRPSPQIRLTYPAYTNQRPTDLPEGTGGVETVAGTRLRLRAATDRRIVRAVLHIEGDRSGIRQANAVAPLAGWNPLMSAAAQSVVESFAEDIPVSVEGDDGRGLSVEFEPALSGLYSLRFTDELGLTGVQKLDIRTFPDPAPVVALLRPTPSLDPMILLPSASIPVRARADDRTYALRSLWLEYKVNDGPFVAVPLADLEAAARLLPAVTGSSGSFARIRSQELESQGRFPIASFRKSNGQAPADGDTVTLRSAANDWDDYALAKQPGRSGELELRILSQDSLTAQLQKELAALRPEIERATALQKEAATRTEAATKSIDAGGRLTNDGLEQLNRAERDQKTLRGQLADPRDGPRSKAEKVRDVARANELGNSPVARRAEAVARILAELDERHLAEIDPRLSAAKQAAERPDAKNPRAVREPLATAAKQQLAALEKLAAAAEELEQWAASAEVRGDARQLKDQVAKAATAAKAATDKLPTGTTPDRLPAEDRAALEKLGEGLDKAADQAGKLISKADRVAEQRRADAEKARQSADAKAAEAQRASADAKAAPAGSPERSAAEAKAAALQREAADLRDASVKAKAEADALDKASKDAGRQAIAEELRQAAEAQRNNRAGEAAANTGKAMERLGKMIDDLAERKDDVEELAKKRKESTDRVDQLADRQDELAKKASKAGDLADGDAKAKEFQKLADDQEALRKETEQLSRKLDRDGAADAAEQLRRAAQEMEQARDDLAQGRDPKANPDEALERLEQAKQELEKDRPKEQNQLDREQREQFAGQFKTFPDKQKAAVEESERLTKAVIGAKKWERPLQASLAALGEREKALAKEIRQFADDKTKELKVFDAMLRQAADQMERAGERIAERKADIVLADPADFDAESERAADETVRRPMRSALRRLEQIVNSLQDDPKKDAGKPKQPMPMAGDMGQPMAGGGGGGGGMAPGVPPIAQLKALRDWQKEVNERTEAFAKDHPDRDKLTDDDKDDLQEIEQAQKAIANLLEDILPLLQQQPGGDLP